MSIRRRETTDGVRYDVQWRLPDRTKRKKTFSSERAAKQFEARLITSSASGESLDPRGGRTELATVYRSWIASRPDLSAKVRRGYEDNWRLRIQPRFGNWPIAKIDHESIQRWVNEMSASGLSPRTVRWTHTVLKMSLDYAIDDGRLIAKNPAHANQVPADAANHPHLSHRKRSRPAVGCLWGSGRRGVDPGVYRPEVRRADRFECRRCRHRREAHPGSPLHHASRRQTRRGQSEI